MSNLPEFIRIIGLQQLTFCHLLLNYFLTVKAGYKYSMSANADWENYNPISDTMTVANSTLHLFYLVNM